MYKDLKSLELIYRQANDTRRRKIPEVQNRKSPQISFVELENSQGPHSKENVAPAPISDASNTSASIIFPAQEIIEVDRAENLSIETVGNENSINSTSLAVENDIKLEAYNV